MPAAHVKILVLYDSQTGNVEQMAPHWMKIDGKIGCAFSSAGGWGGGMELACQSIQTALMNFGFLVFGVPAFGPQAGRMDGHLRARDQDGAPRPRAAAPGE
jgi:multimeric flavodoxin WrbA